MNKLLGCDQYLPCQRCDSWVPGYAKEIHLAECHELSLKNFSHPYIIGSSLFTHATTIGASDSILKPNKGKEVKSKGTGTAKKDKNGKKKGKESTNEEGLVKTKSTHEDQHFSEPSTIQDGEPDWLKKIYRALHYRIVLLNERDLVRCDMVAYSPVKVECGNMSAAFLAVPDEHVRIGHAKLHVKSYELYLPSLRNKLNNSPVWIRKIENVELADEVTFLPSRMISEKEYKVVIQHLMLLMCCTFPIGAPFTLSMGSKVQLPLTSGVNTFEVAQFKLHSSSDENILGKDESLIRKMDNLSMQTYNSSTADTSGNIPSGLITLDEYVASSSDSLASDLSRLQLSDANMSDTFVTLDEVREGDSLNASKIILGGAEKDPNLSNLSENSCYLTKLSEKSLRTSTPKKSVCKNQGKLYDSLLASKIDSNEVSSLKNQSHPTEDTNTLQRDSSWFRVGRHTKMTIPHTHIVYHKNKNTSEVQAEKYCEDSAYLILKKMMHSKLKECKFVGNPLVGSWGGVLLYGPGGTGKTLMVGQAAQEVGVPVVPLTLVHVTQAQGPGQECVRRRIKLARDSAPCVLFMDEIDSLCPAGEGRAARGGDLTSAVVHGLQTLQSSMKPVLVVGASCRPEALDPRLRSSGRLDREVMVPLPDPLHRSAILTHLLATHCHTLQPCEVEEVAGRAYGFSGADLSVLLRGAWLSCATRIQAHQSVEEYKELQLTQDDLMAGLRTVVPTLLRHHHTALSMVRWSDIWGYQPVKTKLQTMVRDHSRAPSDHPLKGTLLYGPPGCSKTMIVRALVTETGFTFFPLKCSDLLSKYVGETEKGLSRVLVRAQQAAPALVFLDEVDSLCGDRGEVGGGLVSELLTLMADRHPGVMVVAATNRPHAVDEALLRPGILEQVIHIDLPDITSRRDIWQGLLEGVPTLPSPLDLNTLSQATAGYSGAEITAIYQEAAQSVLSQLGSREDKGGTISAPSLIPNPPLVINPPSTTNQFSIPSSYTHQSSTSSAHENVQFSHENHQSSVLPTRFADEECIVISEALLLRTIKVTPARTPSTLLQSIAAFTKLRTQPREVTSMRLKS